MSLFRLVADFVRRHWGAYVSSAFMLIGVAVFTVLIPHKIGALIDAMAAQQLSSAALTRGLLELLGMGLAIYVLRVSWRMRLYSAAYQLGVELRTRFYARLSAQGPAFYQHQRTGDLMALATNDIDAIESAAGEAMLAGFDGTLTLVIVLGMMTLGVDWRLAAIALLPFPLMALAFWHISRQIHVAASDALKRFSSLNDHVQEALAGVRTVRALGLEERSARQFGQLTADAADAALRAQKWEAAYEPAVGLTLGAASALTLGLGGYLVWHNQLTIGALTSFTMYLGQLIWPMFAAGWVLSLIQRGKAGLARLQPLLDEPLSVVDAGTVDTLAKGPLVVQGLHFQYGLQAAPALRGVDFALAPGRTLGLVGPTGSGKSTLLKVLLRQVTAQSGSVTWGGHALADYTLETLRAAMAWVPQESFLFSASIAENIALARPGASRAEIEHAARMAAIHDDILRFPQGYETLVGERGITLSGGQRQRVAIARALLADSTLLLLDDALSAVDTGTETAILNHLDELRRARPERSAIIASHRLSSVVDADLILVLHDGAIVESGTHDELLLRDGWYASQWRYQQLEASLDAI
ncbi:MAG: ABC transporter ATP-binding protein [Gammaproteobacteria bacterium]